MQIPWLTRPPTAEEVAAHAKAHPCLEATGVHHGVWLRGSMRIDAYGGYTAPGDLRYLWVCEGQVIGLRSLDEKADARWLPCTAEGIPVCFARRLRKRSKTCEVCGKPSVSLGFCYGHYRRLLRYGSPTGTSITLFEFEGRRQTASQWAAEWGISRQHVRCLSTGGRLRAPAKLRKSSMRASEGG